MVDPFPADRRAQRCHRCYQGKVAFGRRWPVSHQTKQDRFPPHACKLLADVVAEEAAKRLLPDLKNLERKAKKAERIGVGVAKRLALVQADIWAKRSKAGDICELDPLLVEEATCTRTVFSTLVGDLAHQGHYSYVTTKVCDAKFAMCTEPTDNSDSGAVTLAFHGQAPPLSSPNSETRKDSTSTRQQATRVPF